VALVDFWDYTCVTCIRTLTYVFKILEIDFGAGTVRVERAISEHGITYPVLLDNEYATWDRFANRAWPGKHLIIPLVQQVDAVLPCLLVGSQDYPPVLIVAIALESLLFIGIALWCFSREELWV
jgi:hypothetical protein